MIDAVRFRLVDALLQCLVDQGVGLCGVLFTLAVVDGHVRLFCGKPSVLIWVGQLCSSN